MGTGASGASRGGELVGEGIPEEHAGALLRFGALRAPATLFSQLIFWTDLFVLSILWSDQGSAGASQVGVYGAVLRAGQALFLFLTSVSLTFSPFVADLHHRGERDQLDALYKNVTRWTLAATIPVLLVLGILPEETLRIFGPGVHERRDALRILIIGMIVPVMVGTVGFILIMAGTNGMGPRRSTSARFAIDIGVARRAGRTDGPRDPGRGDRPGPHAVVLGDRAAAARPAVPRDLAVRSAMGAPRGARRLLGALTMGLTHAAMPNDRWFLDLFVSAAARCGASTRRAMLAFGLSPTRARRRDPPHPSPVHAAAP